MKSDVLTSIGTWQRNAISGRPLPEGTDFETAVCSLQVVVIGVMVVLVVRPFESHRPGQRNKT